ncbi:MAG: AAA family ATPase, partial [Chloroflexi bacterium]|nr:AAA family ATPase [Chloroflexota bacterium]
MGSACPTCGVKNSDGARYCAACGADLREAHCPECRSVVPEDARFCPSCAAPLPHPEASEERKLVTVLFADVTGSTALGERLDPERFRAVLRAYHAMASAAIRSWGGTVEKYIGDAVMAVFGVPVMREDDAERALQAAQAILERLVPLNRALEEQHAVTLTLRIGVNTGEVIAPSEGVDAQLVAGDAVNVASRLEHSAEPGTVLVGDRTYAATRGSHEFVGPMELQVAGKREPVRAWRLVGQRREAQRGIPGLHAPMVGRDRELDAVSESLREAVEVGRPRTVVIYGPAGIGKSRLLQESLREMRREHSTLRVLRGRCLSAGPGIAFWPLAEILREACGISLDEPAEVAGAKVARTVRDVVGRLGEPEAEIRQTTHALATTAGLALPDNPLDRADPPTVASELARGWPRFATALANERPTVLVVEDLHWASEELVTMLQRVAGRSSGPLLLLATARPEFAESHAAFAVAREDVTILTLRPLNGAQTEQLADELLARTGVPDEIRSILHERAQGNPFFLEEILRGLIDDGILVHLGDGWRPTTGILPDQIPDSLHALLAARIDALPREEKRLLQEAAVVGRIFWEGPLRAAGAGPDIRGVLERLEAKGLVVARPTSTIGGETEYIFKHALVRDVAYAGLPRTRSVR